MGLRGWLKRLEQQSEAEMIAIPQRDGTVRRFYAREVWPECFLHETDRWRRHYDGEDPGEAHPFVEALRGAQEGVVEGLVPEQGTMIRHFLGEDAIIRGEMERPGPPVRETSPGVYE
jgi:hypothetical protein